jgi:hypothetical protein
MVWPLVLVIGLLPKQLRLPRDIDGDPARASSFVSIAFGPPVSLIDRIKLDATCAKRVFDSFRHVAPVGFGPLGCWNSPYGYVDIVRGAVRQGWNDVKNGVHVALMLMVASDSIVASACPLASRTM